MRPRQRGARASRLRALEDRCRALAGGEGLLDEGPHGAGRNYKAAWRPRSPGGIPIRTTILLTALLLAFAATAAVPTAEAGTDLGAQVCFEAIAIDCLGACVDTVLSPPDLCPKVTLPL
jgi:hypothetical protein